MGVSPIASCILFMTNVMPRVVSLPHGWAHVSSNVLTDGEVLDPISGTRR